MTEHAPGEAHEPQIEDAGESGASVAPAELGDEDRLMLILAYMGPLCLVPLLGRGHDPFVRWHARQGLGLAALAAALIIVLYPFDWLFSLVPPLGRLFHASELLIGLGFLLVTCLAVERALAGRKLRIPWLADLADRD